MSISSGVSPAGISRPASHVGPAPVVVTATLRLARELARADDEEAIRAGRVSWVTKDVLPFEAWLRRLWRDWLYSGPARPLTLIPAGAEPLLWEAVIRSSAGARQLVDVSGMAEAAVEAWNLLCRWELPSDGPEWGDTEDTEAFQGWASEFESRLRRNGWLSAAMLPRFLVERLAAGEVTPPGEVRVVGFDELPPASERLLERFAEHGTGIEVLGSGDEALPASSLRAAFADPLDEIRAAASWSRRRVEEEEEREGAGALAVGIVVPDLGAKRAAIARLFREEFDPGSHLETSGEHSRSFNISLGVPLSDYPAVEAALWLLRLRPGPVPVETARACLLTRFLPGADEEHSARAMLLDALGGRREPDAAVSLIEQMASKTCPLLAARLRSWLVVLDAMPERARPGEWVPRIVDILDALGWPGDDAIDSVTYQTRRAFDDLLTTLADLDAVTGRITLSRAVDVLDRKARALQFQPESDPAPVQILGLFEAGGLRFDHVWIMGMDDGAWPRARKASPFLPLALERKHRMPGSSAERDLDYAERLTRRLLSSAARTCIVSHARTDSNLEHGPSPLFRTLREVAATELSGDIGRDYSEHVRRSSLMEVVSDSTGPKWEGTSIRGGIGVLTDQSACPFRAFARARLGAGQPEDACPGLDARDRGRLAHDALERIWSEVVSHDELISTGDSLGGIIARAVDGALQGLMQSRSILRSPAFREIERERLERILSNWLGLEKRRSRFRVVAREESMPVRVGPLKLLVRVDRVDQLPDGTHVLIDYKTRLSSPTAWNGERPPDPQLPVYALGLEAAGRPVSGVCFGVVRTGDIRFLGVAESGFLPGAGTSGEASLEEKMREWEPVVRRLAEEFVGGRAARDPRDGPATCRSCGLGRLCRVGEIGEKS